MSPSKFVSVETEYGRVKGIRKESILGMDYISFQGIPYMKPAVGKLRFSEAQPPKKWIEFDASHDCPSYVTTDMMEPEKIVGQEDAGIINVFTKSVQPDKLFPVMVWIHGGGFQFGSSQTDVYGPDYLLQKDVIMVSMNYRLGAFGFISFNDPSLKLPGNAGLKDQSFALKWIQRNVQNFGGDPNNITLFGESAGSASVHYHMVSDQSKGLFNRAILMSGTVFNNSFVFQPRRNWAQRLAALLGYIGSQEEKDILTFLEAADAVKIVEASAKVLTDEEKYGEKIYVPFGPQIEPYLSDNCFITKDPKLMAREAWSSGIDCLMGGTSNEGLIMAHDKTFQNVDALKSVNYFTPVVELSLKLDDPKAFEFGRMLKQVYYGSMTPSKSNMEGFCYFHGDYNFWHGVQRAALCRVANGSGKTFFYRYDVVTELNVIKKAFKLDDFPGSEHGADLFHLFSGVYAASPKIDSKEFENIKKIVSIWTSFAITGSPKCLSSGAEWNALESTQLPLKCLNIGTDKCEFIELPEDERLAVWNSIYKQSNVDLF